MKKLLLLLCTIVPLGLGHTQASAMNTPETANPPRKYQSNRAKPTVLDQIKNAANSTALIDLLPTLGLTHAQALLMLVREATVSSGTSIEEKINDLIKFHDQHDPDIQFADTNNIYYLVQNYTGSLSRAEQKYVQSAPVWIEWFIKHGPKDADNTPIIRTETHGVIDIAITNGNLAAVLMLLKFNQKPTDAVIQWATEQGDYTDILAVLAQDQGARVSGKTSATVQQPLYQHNNRAPSVSSVATRRALSRDELEELILVIDHPELADQGRTFENAINNIPNIHMVNFNEYVERKDGQRINILAYALDKGKWEYADAFLSFGDTDLTNTSKNEQGKLVTLTQTFNEKNLPAWHTTRTWFNQHGLALTPELPLEQNQQGRGIPEPLPSATENEKRTDTLPQPSPVATPHEIQKAKAKLLTLVEKSWNSRSAEKINRLCQQLSSADNTIFTPEELKDVIETLLHKHKVAGLAEENIYLPTWIEWFIERGAPVDALSEQGYTPLTWAVYYKRLDVARVLLRFGAKASTINKPQGEEPFTVFERYADTKDPDQMLIMDLFSGNQQSTQSNTFESTAQADEPSYNSNTIPITNSIASIQPNPLVSQPILIDNAPTIPLLQKKSFITQLLQHNCLWVTTASLIICYVGYRWWASRSSDKEEDTLDNSSDSSDIQYPMSNLVIIP